VRIYYKELPRKVVQTFNIPDYKYAKYEELKKSIFEKSQKINYKKKITEKDKFILEIEDFYILGLQNIWDEKNI
jgi:hypothetical protein